jgi:transposase-like protein
MKKGTDITAEHFHNAESARQYLEKIRWPSGPICAHCGHDKAYLIVSRDVRAGLYKCAKCRKQFSVTVGTLFERSHIPLHKWLLAVHYLSASKKGISSHQLHRMLGVTYKTAWFMAHRIREAMADPVFAGELGGIGGVIEVDETYWGNIAKKQNRKSRAKNGPRGTGHKQKVVSLVERGGKVRSFHVEHVNSSTLKAILKKEISEDSRIITDESTVYGPWVKDFFVDHFQINHRSGEYGRGPIHTNTIENYYSIMKRALRGTYQHVSGKHLRRYCGEFDFRYNNRDMTDAERTVVALRCIGGKRVTFKEPSKARA